MKPGELFVLESTDYESTEYVIMRALVDFTVDAEIAAWRGEAKDASPYCNDLAQRLVKLGKAAYVELFTLQISTDHCGGWYTLTPEADVREEFARKKAAS